MKITAKVGVTSGLSDGSTKILVTPCTLPDGTTSHLIQAAGRFIQPGTLYLRRGDYFDVRGWDVHDGEARIEVGGRFRPVGAICRLAEAGVKTH